MPPFCALLFLVLFFSQQRKTLAGAGPHGTVCTNNYDCLSNFCAVKPDANDPCVNKPNGQQGCEALDDGQQGRDDYCVWSGTSCAWEIPTKCRPLPPTSPPNTSGKVPANNNAPAKCINNPDNNPPNYDCSQHGKQLHADAQNINRQENLEENCCEEVTDSGQTSNVGSQNQQQQADACSTYVPDLNCSFNMGTMFLAAPGCLAKDWFILDKDENGGFLNITGVGYLPPTKSMIKNEEGDHTIFFAPRGTTLVLQNLLMCNGEIVSKRSNTMGLNYDSDYISQSIIGYEPAHVFVHGGTFLAENVTFFGGKNFKSTNSNDLHGLGGSVYVSTSNLYNVVGSPNQELSFAQVDIRGSLFQDNMAHKGGSIYFQGTLNNEDAGQIFLSSNKFVANFAATDGGALYIDNCDSSTDSSFCNGGQTMSRFDAHNYFTGNAIDSTLSTLMDLGTSEQVYARAKIHFEGCPSGTYTSLSGFSASGFEFTGCPFLCPPGRYSVDREYQANPIKTTDLETCGYKCPEGTYCPSGSGKPISCPAGRYSQQSRLGLPTQCKTCPSGYISPHDKNVDSSTVENADPPGSGVYHIQGVNIVDNCFECTVGMFSTSARSFCLPTSPGYFQNAPGSERVDENDPNDQGQIMCALGKYSSTPSSIECISCPLGFYNDEYGLGSCKECGTGKYNGNTGSNLMADCIECPSGKFSGALSAVSVFLCNECAAGRYGVGAGMDIQTRACTECPVGYASQSAQTSCNPCAAGRTSAIGAVECSVCQPGKFEVAIGTDIGTCRVCPSGYASATQNAPNCTLCEIGKTTSQNGSAICTGCDMGKFGHMQGFCDECSVGYYQDGRGELSCKGCPADTVGTLPARTSRADCSACPDKRTTGGTIGNTDFDACVCRKGYYFDSSKVSVVNDTDGLCLSCPVPQTNCTNEINVTLDKLPAASGFYRHDINTATFYLCDNAADCPGGSMQEQCAKGHGGVLCAICKPGHVRIDGMCTACPSEFASGTRITGLVLVGTVPPVLLIAFLVVYFSRKEKSPSDSEKEKKNGAPRSSSKCEVSPVAALTSITKEKSTDGGEKEKKNGASKSSAKCKVRPVVRPTSVTKAQKVIKGASMRSLLSLKQTAQIAQSTGIKEMVANGAAEMLQGEVEGLVEGLAAEGTGDTAGDEVEVETNRAGEEVMNVVKNKEEEAMNVVKNNASIKFTRNLTSSLGHKIRILIGYMQITSALVFSFDVPWPPITMSFLSSLSFINFNFVSIFEPIDPCIFNAPFLSQASFHMAILPICIVCVALASICTQCCNSSRVVRERAGNAMVTLTFLLYPGIVTRVFTTLKCRQIGSEQYLVADYSVVCWGEEHMPFASLMFACIGVYVFGIPIGMILLLWWNKRILHPEHLDKTKDPILIKRAESFDKVFGSLYAAYEEKYWWFEGIIMIQKALLTGGLVMVAPGTSAQILVGLVIALSFYTLLLRLQPYAGTEEDQLQTIATASTVATLLIGFTLKATEAVTHGPDNTVSDSGLYDSAVMDVILIGLVAIVALSGLWISVKSLPCLAA